MKAFDYMILRTANAWPMSGTRETPTKQDKAATDRELLPTSLVSSLTVMLSCYWKNCSGVILSLPATVGGLK